MRTSTSVLSAVTIFLLAHSALADDAPTGAPPPDASALVSAPKASADVPKFEKATDMTSVTLSAGGQWATGNSRQLAATANGVLQLRRGSDGFGASVLGNYAEGHAPGAAERITTQNLQGRVRYDRYILDPLSLFLIATGRHDRFEGLDFRLNLDPGVKYLFVNTTPTQFWGELGYDFQYDIRRDDAIFTTDPTTGVRVQLVPKTMGNHSSRVYLGLKHAFNKEVNLATGVEYIQSLLHSYEYWVNYEAIFAANLGGGLSLGLGFTARFEQHVLPNVKQQWDTTTTASLIYAFSGPPPAPPPPPPPCVPTPPPPPADTTPPVQTMPPPAPVQTMPPPATTNAPPGP